MLLHSMEGAFDWEEEDTVLGDATPGPAPPPSARSSAARMVATKSGTTLVAAKIEFCREACKPDGGAYDERHVPTAHNVADYLGKLVEANKAKQSIRYLSNSDCEVPVSDAHRSALDA